MSGAITAAVVGAGALYMSYEQNRQARAAAREQKTAVEQEQAKIAAEIAWEKKKKGEQDKLSARSALRLRGGPSGGGMGASLSLGPMVSEGELKDKLGL